MVGRGDVLQVSKADVANVVSAAATDAHEPHVTVPSAGSFDVLGLSMGETVVKGARVLQPGVDGPLLPPHWT